MGLEENEIQIYSELVKNRYTLYSILLNKIDENINNYFSLRKNIGTYEPVLDSSLNVIKQTINDNAFVDHGNGVVSLKGAVLEEGWPNQGVWEMSVDVSFDSLRYIGIILLADANNPFPNQTHSLQGWGIRNWEGPVTGTPHVWLNGRDNVGTYTKTPNVTLADGDWHATNIDWYTLHIKKTSPVKFEVWKNNDTDNKVVYIWQELSDVPNVTFGAVTNGTASAHEHGSMFIRNFSVTYDIPIDTLTELCEKTKTIKCATNNSATLPITPTSITPVTIASNEKNIQNKIQYCNNVLRYTLRKRGIDFTDEETNELSNEMHELIQYIDEILSPSEIQIDNIYSAYDETGGQ